MKKLAFLLLIFTLFSSQKCGTDDCENIKDCMPERINIATHESQRGTIKEVMPDYFAIIPDKEGQRFGPCNLESEYRQEGLKVIFCGVEKATLPNEKRVATPFVLAHIKTVD